MLRRTPETSCEQRHILPMYGVVRAQGRQGERGNSAHSSGAPSIRERRRTLRNRNLLVRQMVQMKIKISALLMEAGVSYNKQLLHKAGYFRELLATNPDIDKVLCSLLRICRETVVRLGKTESALVGSLERDSLLMERLERLMTIPAVGPITALTWALEGGGCAAVLLNQESRQLLRVVRSGEKFWQHGVTHATSSATSIYKPP
jgi:transposase